MSKAIITEQHLHDIADAIIAKGGATAAMTPAQMPAAIANIPSGGDRWVKPSDWPDLHALLERYPAPEGFPHRIAMLLDDSSSDVIFNNSRERRCVTNESPDGYFSVTSDSVSFTAGTGGYRWMILALSSADEYTYDGIRYVDVVSDKDNLIQMNEFLWIIGDMGPGVYFRPRARFAVNLQCLESNRLVVQAYFVNHAASLREVIVDEDIVIFNSGTYVFGECFCLEVVSARALVAADNLARCDSLFTLCYNLRSVPELRFPNITNADSIFYRCDRMKSYPKIDIGSATSANNIFSVERSSIDEVPVRITINCSFNVFTGTTWWPNGFKVDTLVKFDESGEIIDGTDGIKDGGMVGNINTCSNSGQTITFNNEFKNLFKEQDGTFPKWEKIKACLTAKNWGCSPA